MGPGEMERTMREFYARRINLLIASTIIENGIDVPTANTIIINRADKFGLAQLHQLRGRVGRSHHLAYAYMITPPWRSLTTDARKRLEAIQSLEELGAGFTLATHDLEIRGAGELLGEDQSGQIEAIGFQLYSELLDRTVEALKAGIEPDLDEPVDIASEVDLHTSALIPTTTCPTSTSGWCSTSASPRRRTARRPLRPAGRDDRPLRPACRTRSSTCSRPPTLRLQARADGHPEAGSRPGRRPHRIPAETEDRHGNELVKMIQKEAHSYSNCRTRTSCASRANSSHWRIASASRGPAGATRTGEESGSLRPLAAISRNRLSWPIAANEASSCFQLGDKFLLAAPPTLL
jgi:transcription-repair coupling factor (superfamily II helicase)